VLLFLNSTLFDFEVEAGQTSFVTPDGEVNTIIAAN